MDDSTDIAATASDTPAKTAQIRRSPVPPDKKHSNAQPLWHLILLDLITGGLYFIYWSYRNWKHLKDYKNLDVAPWKKALALLIPIAGIAYAYEQFVAFRDFSKEVGAKISFDPAWMVIGLIALNVASRLPDPYWIVSFLSVVPIAIVQRVLNSAWSKAEPGLHMRKLPTVEDFLAVTASWVILWILGMIFGWF